MKKKALITGASGEIGSAIAKKLAQKDHDLILLGFQNAEKLETLAQGLQSEYGVHASVFCGDLADEDFIGRCFDECFPETGLTEGASFSVTGDRTPRLDLLVNNAGISHIGLLQDMTDREWHRVIDTNLTSVFHTCRAAIPLMLRTRCGRILNISSVWGNTGASTEVAYSASKGGLNAFTKALARELAPSGIPVNAIACGYIDTAMNAHLTEEEKNGIFSEIPAGRPGTPQEVAELTALLAEAPPYLTGQIITMDGAWT